LHYRFERVFQIVLSALGSCGQRAHLVFSPDGRLVASASADGTAQLWDTSTGRRVRTLHGHTDRVLASSFSPDGTVLVSSGTGGAVRL
jgi:WD40 repeat protein